MIDGLFTPEEFARQTTSKRSRNRALFGRLDAALLTAHRAATVHEQLQTVQSLLSEIGELKGRYARLASKLRDKSLYRAHSTVIASWLRSRLGARCRFAARTASSRRQCACRRAIARASPKTSFPSKSRSRRSSCWVRAAQGRKQQRPCAASWSAQRCDRQFPGRRAPPQAHRGAARSARCIVVRGVHHLLDAAAHRRIDELDAALAAESGEHGVIRCLSPMVVDKAIAIALLRRSCGSSSCRAIATSPTCRCLRSTKT